MSPSSSSSSFRQLHKFKPEYSASTFTQYESEKTGMRVVTIDQKGPKVSGYFVLATEIHDDSGAPHTLEHLCFMGSRNYRYKGFLDKLATRVYSDTNAWTATDHTAYTLETAGWDGFATILPIYLEHIIAPTLTDAGCYTEVYHVDGTGHDAGVVYSEMQGVQNNATELIDLRSRRLLYPEGVGFRYETGGMMEQLRVLTAERIREFHRHMYQPKNLCLVITGEVDHADLLQRLEKFEETILDVIPSPDAPFTRPWTDSVQPPPLRESVVETVEFPEEDESFGEVEIRFFGPDCRDSVQTGALNVTLLYLAGSPATVLENTLVEKEQVATGVYYSTDDRLKTEIRFTLTSVATDQLAAVEKRFFEVLREAMEKAIDMKYIRECIQRQKRSWKFATEYSASSFAEYVIGDFLFGEKDGTNLLDVATLAEYDTLEEWTDNDWRGFMMKWLSEAPHVSILGKPSAKLVTKLKEEEESRVNERKSQLGEEGLKRLEQKLEEAKAENDKEIPKELLAKFKVPDTDSIRFIHTTTSWSGPALKLGHPKNEFQKFIDADGSELPLFLHFEHINSNFVQITLMISTNDLPTELLPLLAVYTEAFFNLPVERNGETISFEQIVVELERDTVGYSMDSGRINPEMLNITLQVEVEKYDTAVSWLKELTWKSIFDVDRLVAINTRLFSDVPDSKRSGSSMLEAVRAMTQYGPNSIIRAKTTLVKARYLKLIKQLLKNHPEEVVSKMEEIRNLLFRPENFRVLVIADLTKLSNPVSSWNKFIDGLDTSKPLHPVVKLTERLSEEGKYPGRHAHLVPMPTVDSSFANASAKGPSTYDDPKLPALMVAVAYMNAVEGPLWVAVRGTGLAYGASFRYNIDSGFVHFSIYRSPNAYNAFMAAKKVVEDHLSGEAEIDPLMALEGAISTIVATYAGEQATYFDAAQDSFVRQIVHNLPPDYKEKMLKKLRSVDIPEVKEILREMILPMFTPSQSDVVVTCAPVLEKPIKEGFESVGYKLEVHSLKHFEDDYGLKLREGEEEEEDEDEDEEGDDSGSDDDSEEENSNAKGQAGLAGLGAQGSWRTDFPTSFSFLLISKPKGTLQAPSGQQQQALLKGLTMNILQELARLLDRPFFPWKKVLVGFSLGQYLIEGFLSLRQYKVLQQTKPPKVLAGEVSQDVFDKSQAYGRAKAKFGFFSGLYGQIQNLAFIYYDALPKLWAITGIWMTSYLPERFSGEISHTLIFLFTFNIITTLLSLPTSYYSTFVLEEKFGFNKQTVKLWVSDMLKGQMLSIVLGTPIISAILKIVQTTGTSFFYYLWMFGIGAQLFAITIYPIAILPLFNKLSPLEPGQLKTGVETLAKKLEFPLKELHVIDGSKRSAHSNAYFYGLPWKKHIVIYDTLIEKSEPEEVVAVLSHELGHWSLSHTTKLFGIAQFHMFYIFALFSAFVNNKSLYQAFGFHNEYPIMIGFLLFSDALAPMDAVVKLLMNILSRKFEFEADAFAVKLGYSKELARSLLKLQIQNLSTMDADWMYASYHYSHPILPERLAAIGWTGGKVTADKAEDSEKPVKAADREL